MQSESIETIGGEQKVYTTIVAPIKIGEEITGTLGVNIDITERKRMEVELLQTRERLQYILSLSPVVIYSCKVSTAWGTTFVSENVTELFGWSPQDFMADPAFWNGLIHPDDYERISPGFQRLLTDRHLLNEYRLRCKDGTYRWIRDEVRLVGDGINRPKEIIGCWTDITENKQAAEDLAVAREEAERRAAELESFISSIADGASLLDTEGSIVWMNNAGRAIIGADTDESFAEWEAGCKRYSLNGELISPEQYPVYRALQGESVQEMRYKLVAPTGKEVIVSTSASPVRDAEGRIIGATTIFRDISEMAVFELQLHEVYEHEHHIADVLQKALVTQVNIEVPGYKVVGDYRPALKEAQVGGDFYDVFKLPDGCLAIVMGDVSGKGLQAAVHTAMTKYMLRAFASENPEPGQVLERLNQAVHAFTSDDTFVTIFYGILDPDTRILTYANAGHDEPLFHNSNLGCIVPLDLTGRAIGAFPGSTYGQHTISLLPGDMLLIYTDGITDARAGNLFLGQDGLAKVISANTENDEEFIVGAVMTAATEHAGGNLLDDAAVVIIKAKAGEDIADKCD